VLFPRPWCKIEVVKIFKPAATWLFIVCLPVLLLTLVIAILVNSLWLYTGSAERYGVAVSLANAGLPVSDTELSGIYSKLIRYYNSGEEYVDITVARGGERVDVLTPEEVQHFKDVKGLVRLDYGVLAGVLAVCLAVAGLNIFLWRDRRRLGQGLMGGGIFTVVLLLTVLLLDRLYGFENLFIQFHFIFFDNMYWLGAADSVMLLLFPENLFVDAAAIGFAAIAVLALALGGVGWWLRKTGPAPA
jgi:integral membrane protein (TIGR01906 family)